MDVSNNFTEELITYSKKIGIDLIGFADPKLVYKYSKVNLSFSKEIGTIIIIGMYLFDIILDAWCQNHDNKKEFHFLDSILENRCHLIKDYLGKEGFKSKIISYSPGLFLKDIAALAGIGPIGRNNLLITLDFGSQVRLRALITTAKLQYGNPVFKNKFCENCKLCIEACPANALENERYNKDKCLSYNHNNLRKLSKKTSIWCNICIDSCPIRKKSTDLKEI